MGAGLVADDVTEVFLDDVPMARAPSSLPAMIEARGIGLLQTELVPQAQAFVALDLAKSTDVRMPEPQFIRLMGYDVPLLHRPAGGPVAAMLLQYLKSPSE